MNLALKVIAIIALLGLVAFAAAFGVSRYLVSKLDGGGTGTPGQTLQPYSSEDGIAFSYPADYRLSSKTLGNGEYAWDELLIVPQTPASPQNGEEPPAIHLSVFPDVTTSLEQWVRGDARSDFKLSDDRLASTSVGGVPALRYRRTGLYEADVVAVLYKGKIFLFEGEWITADDNLRADFNALLQSVHFTI